MDDCLQVITRRLYTAEAELKTSEMDQSEFVVTVRVETGPSAVICSVVAVTFERKVAMVVRFKYR